MAGYEASDAASSEERKGLDLPAYLKDIQTLGSGASGEVHLCEDSRNGSQVAVKVIRNFTQDPLCGKRILREIRLLAALRHENLVWLLDLPPVPDPDFDDVYIVMPYLYSDLHKVIYSKMTLSESHCQAFVCQILRGLKYLHSAGVAHRDLKPSNIWVNKDCSLRIADFGLARGPSSSEEELTSYVVTPWYRAPELMLQPCVYFEAVDLWSVGCIHFELMARDVLFHGKEHVDMLQKISATLGFSMENDLTWVPEKEMMQVLGMVRSLKLPEQKASSLEERLPKASEDCLDLLNKFLDKIPTRRITASAALDHPYLLHLHDPVGESTAPRPFAWDFDHFEPSKRALKDRVYAECARLHPEIVARDKDWLSAHGFLGQGPAPSGPPPSRAQRGPTVVFVALLNGRSCHCNSEESRTVLELKEEAEKKLGIKIKHIIGQDHEPLDESLELAAAQIVPGSTLTAVISAEEIEEAHPEAQAPAQAMPEDDFEMKDFGHGICLMALQRIFDEFSPKVEVLENWSDLKNVSVLEQVLPAGHVPLARLLRLTPEDQPFPVPVKVLLPTCAGADTVWRSTSAGWEKVDTVTFDNGRAMVQLHHFCDLAITGKCIPLKGLGFVHPEGTNAQIVIMHIGCESCQRGLELLCSDEDVLQPLRRCGPSVQLGTFTHNEELEIQQAGRTSKVRMRFDKMPLSRRLRAQSGLHFDVDIDGENHCFEAPLVPGSPATAPQPAPDPPSGHPAGSASQAPAVPRGAVGSSGVPNPLASTDGHLMLSGRFNRDEIVVYMKEVKSQLETRNVPVFMVDASVGQNFGHMTREGLCRAKGMVAFCTSEYGAYTGVGYETFHELEFAHENELPLFPIRLSELWPPAPQNNERGTHQNRLVFKKSLVFAEDRQMTNARGVADQIAESVARMGIFRN